MEREDMEGIEKDMSTKDLIVARYLWFCGAYPHGGVGYGPIRFNSIGRNSLISSSDESDGSTSINRLEMQRHQEFSLHSTHRHEICWLYRRT
jgi:hypothetical protein